MCSLDQYTEDRQIVAKPALNNETYLHASTFILYTPIGLYEPLCFSQASNIPKLWQNTHLGKNVKSQDPTSWQLSRS